MTAADTTIIELLSAAEGAFLDAQAARAGIEEEKLNIKELEKALASAKTSLATAEKSVGDADAAFKKAVQRLVDARKDLTAESVETMISTRALLLTGGNVAGASVHPAAAAGKTKAKEVERTPDPVTPPAEQKEQMPVEEEPAVDQVAAADDEVVAEVVPDASDEEVDASESDAEETDGFDPLALAGEEQIEVWDEEDAETEAIEPPSVEKEKPSAGRTPGSRSNRPAAVAAGSKPATEEKPVEAPVEPASAEDAEAEDLPEVEGTPETADSLDDEPPVAAVEADIPVERISDDDLPDFLQGT